MTTLVTGHGLVGARAVDALVARGEDVVVFDLAAVPERAGVRSVVGDLLDLGELRDALRVHAARRLVHTAGLLTPAAREQPYDLARLNVGGTVNVLEAARAEGISRVVFCSSVVVYDAAIATSIVDERHPTHPRTLYAASKLAGEILGREYARLGGFGFLALRFAAVYGPTLHPTGGVTRVVHDAVAEALATGRARVRRRWPGRQELLFSVDAGAALAAAALADGETDDVLNIGSGERVSAADVASAVAEVTGAAVEVVDADADTNPYVVDGPLALERARTVLGWRPEYDIRRGVAALAAWLAEHPTAPAAGGVRPSR